MAARPAVWTSTEQVLELAPLVTVKVLVPVVVKLALIVDPLVELRLAPALGDTDQE